MGKPRAEIQREYRERKKAKEGALYMKKERERISRYYVPVDQITKKDKTSRRDIVKQKVKLHRYRKRVDAQGRMETNTLENVPSTSSADVKSKVSASTNVTSKRAQLPRLVVKMPSFELKQRTRTRISRATAKCRREIGKLNKENEAMLRKYKTISKRYERLRSKIGTKVHTEENVKQQSSMEPNEALPKHADPKNLTPKKRLSTDLRAEGVTPSKLPKVVLNKLLLANVVADEIDAAWQSNGPRGKKAISRLLSGKVVSKYKLQRRLSNLTGIKRRNLTSNSKKVDSVPMIQRKVKYINKLREEVKAFLERDDNSRMMPGKADKVKTKVGNVQTRVLNDNMANLHMKFRAETPHKISKTTFCRLRPKFIRLTKYITRNKCLCQKHQNMALLLKSTKSVGGEVPLNPDEYAKQLKDTNPQTLLNGITAGIITYNQWAKVTCADGKTRTKIVEKELNKEEFCKLFLQKSAEFKQHVDRVHQQYKAIRELKDNLPIGHIIVQMDFSENYTCSSADEVQSAYWNSNTVTLHPTVVYYKTQDDELEHKSYMFVSDDNGHNIGAVNTFMKKLVPDIKAELINVEKVHYWTDSPSSQYRNKTAFYLTSAHEQLLTVPATWDYFEAGHGKGPCDGLGGAAKRMADLAVKQGKMGIQDATDFFVWGQKYQTSVKYIYVSKEECDQSRNEIAEINKGLVPVKGTLQVHSVTPVGLGKVRTCVTSCYCEKCLSGSSHQGTTADLLRKEKKTSAVKDKVPVKPAVTANEAEVSVGDVITDNRVQKNNQEDLLKRPEQIDNAVDKNNGDDKQECPKQTDNAVDENNEADKQECRQQTENAVNENDEGNKQKCPQQNDNAINENNEDDKTENVVVENNEDDKPERPQQTDNVANDNSKECGPRRPVQTDKAVHESNVEDESKLPKVDMYNQNDWVFVRLEGKGFIGKIIKIDTKDKDCKVTFMRKSTSINIEQIHFKWPKPVDKLWVKFSDILLHIDEPVPVGRSGRSFSITKEDLEKILTFDLLE